MEQLGRLALNPTLLHRQRVSRGCVCDWLAIPVFSIGGWNLLRF
jgi:hypothetical protein